MFKRDRCDVCGDCLVECQWVKIGREEAQRQMGDLIAGLSAPILKQCATCFACNETCPNDANPFDLILEMQERTGALGIPPEAIASNESRYTFSGDPDLSGQKSVRTGRVMTVCVFGGSDANLIQGPIYDLPILKGKPYFCWVLFMHMGNESVMRRHAKEFVARLQASGAKEIVCFHDDCYSMLTVKAPEYGIEPPFRAIHLSEYLAEYLKSNNSRLRRLDVDLAYQRPCASRLTPGKERFIDEVFELAGARRVKRRYDRRGALCCGGPKMLLGQGSPRAEQEKNISDALAAGAKALVCLCPMCMRTLKGTASELGMPLLFIGDLARIALGEIEAPWR